MLFWPVIIAATLAALFHEFYWKRRKLPPGPVPLPLIGNLIQLAIHFPGFDLYRKWMEQYGPVYTYWLGNTAVVTVNDIKTIQESFINDGDTYADRAPFLKMSEEYRGGRYGIIDTSGYLWREQRRFALHTLRDFGLGKSGMEERILNETTYMLDLFESETKKNGTFGPIPLLERTVASVINIVIFGYRYDDEHTSEFCRLRKLLDDQTAALSNPLFLFVFQYPALQGLPLFKPRIDLMYHVRDELFDYFKKNIAEHKASIDYETEDAHDFCEAYLKEMHKREKEDPSTTFSDIQLVNTILDLWVAGMETTAATLTWGMALMVHHPEVLTKVQQEIDGVVGRDRLVCMDDRQRLPYTCATINEMQRYGNIIPQNLLRTCNKDVVVGGHSVPSGTAIAPQISMLLYDPEVFPEPHAFRPERFIDSKGHLITYKQLLPFSVGKRQCPGEGLAKMELFLFFANLAHRFDILPEKEGVLPSLVRTFKSSTKCPHFNCKIVRRSFS